MSQLFLIGHPRCGTTSLNSWLSQSPEICASKKKEIFFFTKNYHEKIEWYKAHFENSGGKTILDATPNHSYINFAAERIHHHYPNAKIIQIIRDPAERVFSWWRIFHNMRAGREPRDFSTFLKEDIQTYDPNRYRFEKNYIPFSDYYGGCYNPCILESGAYSLTRERYIRLFGSQNVLTIPFNRLIKKPLETVNEILLFADLKKLKSLNSSPSQIDSMWPSRNARDIANEELHEWQRKAIYELYEKELSDSTIANLLGE